MIYRTFNSLASNLFLGLLLTIVTTLASPDLWANDIYFDRMFEAAQRAKQTVREFLPELIKEQRINFEANKTSGEQYGSLISVEEFENVIDQLMDPEQFEPNAPRLVEVVPELPDGLTAINHPFQLGTGITLEFSQKHLDEINSLDKKLRLEVEEGLMIHEISSIIFTRNQDDDQKNLDKDYGFTSDIIRARKNRGGTSSGGGDYTKILEIIEDSERPLPSHNISEETLFRDDLIDRIVRTSRLLNGYRRSAPYPTRPTPVFNAAIIQSEMEQKTTDQLIHISKIRLRSLANWRKDNKETGEFLQNVIIRSTDKSERGLVRSSVGR